MVVCVCCRNAVCSEGWGEGLFLGRVREFVLDLQMLRIRFKHSWGTAEKLYKSEAIDSFGNKYLLGVYETVKEAEKAFDEWNKEHPGPKHPARILSIARICGYTCLRLKFVLVTWAPSFGIRTVGF